MRSGAEYRAALRDGRRVHVMGEGAVADVTTHPATCAMVDDYARWYDRHAEPEWRELLHAPDGTPWAMTVPKDSAELRGMARSFAATLFLSAGNVTHTPAYGHLIALGVAHLAFQGSERATYDAIEAWRAGLAASGRFATFAAGSAPIGHRLAGQPGVQVLRETDAGFVVQGKVGMHTSPCFAEDIFVGNATGAEWNGKRASFVVQASQPGVTILCRRVAARGRTDFAAPLSNRYDELDGGLWLDEVLIPHDRFILHGVVPEAVARWLFWHQLQCWLAKAEFTLGLALACAKAMGLSQHDETVEYLIDLTCDVQMVRSCLAAAALEPETTPEGYAAPNVKHVAAGSLTMLRARPRMAEILRILPGSSLVLAPTDTDLDNPALAAGLEAAFGGGGFTARQRSALLQLAWDHVGSTLDHREHVFELHANGGVPLWRARMRRAFEDYDRLANGVLKQLDLPMPVIDLTAHREAPMLVRRQVPQPPR